MSCDVGKATEGLENELWCRSRDGKFGEWAELPSLYIRHSSFSNPSVALPTSQFSLQPFFRFSYVTSSSFNSPGEPPMAKSQDRLNWLLPVYIKPFEYIILIWDYHLTTCETSFNVSKWNLVAREKNIKYNRKYISQERTRIKFDGLMTLFQLD